MSESPSLKKSPNSMKLEFARGVFLPSPVPSPHTPRVKRVLEKVTGKLSPSFSHHTQIRPLASEAVISFKKCLMEDIKSQSVNSVLIQELLQRVAIEKNTSLNKVVDMCLLEFDSLCYQLSKESQFLGLTVDCDCLKTQLSIQKKIGEEVSALAVKLVANLQNKPFEICLRDIFTQTRTGFLKSSLETISCMKIHKDLMMGILGKDSKEFPKDDEMVSVTEEVFTATLQKEDVYWQLIEWMPTDFRSRVLKDKKSIKSAAEECIEEIESKTGLSQQEILKSWIQNFNVIDQHIRYQFLIKEEMKEGWKERSLHLRGVNEIPEYLKELNWLKGTLECQLEKPVASARAKRFRNKGSKSLSFLKRLGKDPSCNQEGEVVLDPKIKDKIHKSIPFMRDLATALIKSSTKRARDYGKILQSIYLACRQTEEASSKVEVARKNLERISEDRNQLKNRSLGYEHLQAERDAKREIALYSESKRFGLALTQHEENCLELAEKTVKTMDDLRCYIDVEDQISEKDKVLEIESEVTVKIADSLKAVTQEDLVFEFNSVLSSEEKRLLNEGHGKMIKLGVGKEAVKSSLIGQGASGSSYQAINIAKFVDLLNFLRMGDLSKVLTVDEKFKEEDVYDEGGYEDIVRKAARGETRLSSSQIEFLTTTLKEGLRESRVAEKIIDPAEYEPMDEDVKKALEDCPFALLPRTERTDMSISKLGVCDLDDIKMTPDEACQAIVTIAKGLQDIHDRGVMHGDLKPNNLVLLKKGDFSSVKFIDFDLSLMCEEYDELARQGDVVFNGTVAYMSPEVLDAYNNSDAVRFMSVEDIGRRSDLFALGVTICNLLGLEVDMSFYCYNREKKIYRDISKLENELREVYRSGIITFKQLELTLNLLSGVPERRPLAKEIARAFEKRSVQD